MPGFALFGLPVLIAILLADGPQDHSLTSQVRPWNPPKTTIPVEFVDATKFLLEHGMADPRGGEYREATILTRNSWNAKAKDSVVHGWTFPDGYVVCWDGISYQAKTIGNVADMAKDMEATLSGVIPTYLVSESSIFPTNTSVTTAMLLLSGNVNLAERNFVRHGRMSTRNTFVDLASPYLVTRYHRAVEAHMADDDALAFQEASSLEKEGPAFEREAVQRIGRETVDRLYVEFPGSDSKGVVFRFLEPVSRLAEDSARRLRESRETPNLQSISTLEIQDRISKLILWLDEVKARQWGQPGGVSITSDPIAKALVQEGEAAVEPLLGVIETDKRLTRSVGFFRDFHSDRYLISVAGAARAIVSDILQLSLWGNPGRPYSLEELRAFWKENRGRSRAERLYFILLNETDEHRRWIEAAIQIAQSIEIRREGYWVTVPKKKPGDPQSKIVGEELRSKSNPSVSELISMRALQVAGMGPLRSSGDQFACAEALRMGIALAKWEPAAAKDTLARLMSRALELTVREQRGGAADAIYDVAGSVTVYRVGLGDAQAWKDYETLILRFKPEGSLDPFIYVPLWKFAKHPEAKRIAKTVLMENPAFYLPSDSRKGVSYTVILNINSPLLKIPAFRELLMRLMSDKTTIGTVYRDDMGIRYDLGSGGGNMAIDWSKDKDFKNWDSATLRSCDHIAMFVGHLKGAPFFNPVWPAARKDAVIFRMKRFVASLDRNVDQVISDYWQWRMID